MAFICALSNKIHAVGHIEFIGETKTLLSCYSSACFGYSQRAVCLRKAL